MFFVMHCGGIPFNGDTIKTKSLGGSESAAYYVAKELAAQGHHVTLFTNSPDTGTFDGVKYEWAGNITEELPLGDRFTFYAEKTPHDVCIIQRHPRAFERKYASKQNLWWLHDLALYRTRDLVLGQMWNVDKVLVVSAYHKKQVMKVYGLPSEAVQIIGNGVDHAIYDTQPAAILPASEYHIFYSSRPERGLRYLVEPGGIMEQLEGTGIHLHVCGYDNTTPQMRDEYEHLWARCEALPNVTNHGSLTKHELASLQKACSTWVYPTTFEEVSCITAMEAMAAGCNVLTTAVAALPETCAGAVGELLPLEYGEPEIKQFVNALRDQCAPSRDKQRELSLYQSWRRVTEMLHGAVRSTFVVADRASLAHHFIRHSDVKAFEALEFKPDGKALATELLTEYGIAYKFYRENTYAEHYAAVYARETERGVIYGPEDVTGTTRFMAVANMVGQLPAGSRVLDYGCAHGHYTVALARRYPELAFIGADITQSNIDAARKWAQAEGLTNIDLVKVEGVDDANELFNAKAFDLIIAAEVIEHVGDPQHYIDALASHLSDSGRMVITVPYGPWEAIGYREHGYWRAHLHHFERQDLLDMLGHHPNYRSLAAPNGMSPFHSQLGSYVVSFDKPTEPSRPIDYERKIAQTMPDQTITCCMIVKDAAHDILRCLNSFAPHVQELIVGIDRATIDDTHGLVARFATQNPLLAVEIIELDPVVETGFAAARNETIARASGDWIMWIDADEVLVNGAHMGRYLRNSMYNGFAVKQHHFSHDPVGIIKVDLPCRVFRNRKGIEFFGIVHEHPEQALNEGLGPVSILPSTYIVHHGYVDEGVRRNRFSRNLPLLERDRKEHPERLLGKFLWLRDLAQSCQYDMEDNTVDPTVVRKRIDEGILLWLELLEAKNYRLVLDALPYYSQLAVLRGGGLEFSFSVDASELHEVDATKEPVVSGYFVDKKHALALMNGLTADKIGDLDRRYL